MPCLDCVDELLYRFGRGDITLDWYEIAVPLCSGNAMVGVSICAIEDI